jgi:hypothetical protein
MSARATGSEMNTDRISFGEESDAGALLEFMRERKHRE